MQTYMSRLVDNTDFPASDIHEDSSHLLYAVGRESYVTATRDNFKVDTVPHSVSEQDNTASPLSSLGTWSMAQLESALTTIQTQLDETQNAKTHLKQKLEAMEKAAKFTTLTSHTRSPQQFANSLSLSPKPSTTL